ncbi:MAG: DUF2029 domain-containing protein [Bacteroidales bacterium]|jgi:hypothetical protein|nr:DUF2029 domain-containing protein [Bacteroidales bacterium]
MKKNKIYKSFIVCAILLIILYWGIGLSLTPFAPRFYFEQAQKIAYREHRLPDSGYNFSNTDGEHLWIGSTLFLKGKNPLQVLLCDEEPPFGVGHATTHNTPYLPWSYVVGNIFTPGFLSVMSALWWELILSLLLVIWMGRKIYNVSKNENLSHTVSLLVVLLCLAQYGFTPSLAYLNPSLFVIPLLILSSLYSGDKNWFLTGTLLGLAMLKPQITALFFIPFLVRGQWKSITTGVMWIIIPLLVASVVYCENPIKLILDYMQGTTEKAEAVNNDIYYGFFDPLQRCFGVAPGIVTLLQVIVFGVTTLLLCYRYRNASNMVLFSIPAVFSTCWMYTVSTNLTVLALLIMAVMSLLHQNPKRPHIMKTVLIAGIIFMLMPIPELIRRFYSPVLFPLVQHSIYIVLLVIVLKLSATSKLGNARQ